MLYLAYLDEFGHIGPFISRDDPAYKTSPVFGLAGMVLPYDRVREFATWFYKLKCHLLEFEISKDGTHPARWEKKGSALLTTTNIQRYPEVRRAINRILNKIQEIGGFVFYRGITKTASPEDSSSERLYASVLRDAIMSLDRHCEREHAQFLLVLDESDAKFHRDVIVRKAAMTMFGQDFCSRLVEPPTQVCSYLYQTVQCADWICGLMGRLGAYEAEPVQFAEFEWARRYFKDRLQRVSNRSRIRTRDQGLKIAADRLARRGAALVEHEIKEDEVEIIAFETQ